MKADYTVALYIRISQEDRDILENGKAESGSIKNQRDLLYDFIRRTPEFTSCRIIEFHDDGWTGTNFKRPAVKDMLERARKREIDCIMVKDLSRFGRNHLEAGVYLEQIFPAWGVRFISVNDGFDSDSLTPWMDIAFRNFIYELYSKDLSEKVRSAWAVRAKNGEYTSAYAFYGYVKSKSDIHKLVVDEEAAKVVRYIYTLALDGRRVAEIARLLNKEKIPTPKMRQEQNNCGRKWRTAAPCFWNSVMVSKVLREERYTGKMISNKRKRLGNSGMESVPKQDWIVVHNTHEALISGDIFRKAQRIFRAKKKNSNKNKNMKRSFLRGKIKCGICNRALRKSGSRNYICLTKKYMTELSCIDEAISEDTIEKTLFSIIRLIAFERLEIQPKASQIDQKKEELKSAVKKTRLKKLEAWEGYKAGALTEEEFMRKRNAYSNKINGFEGQLTRLESKTLSREVAAHTRSLIEELVKEIYVYDGERLEIVWNFVLVLP